MPHLFDVVLDVQDEEAVRAGGHAGAPAAALAQQLLSQPHGYAARYPALVRLLPRVGARAVLAERPALALELLVASAATEAPSPAPGDFLVHVLVAHRREIEASRGLPVGHDGGSSVGWRRGQRDGSATATLSKKKVKAAKKGAAVDAARSSDWDEATAQASLVARLSAEGLSFLLQLETLGAAVAATASVYASCEPQLAGAAEFIALATAAHDSPLAASDPESGLRAAAAAVALATALAAAPIPGSEDTASSQWVAWAADELLHADAYRRWSAAWLPDAAACLLHPRRLTRFRTVSYGLPALLRLDAEKSPMCLIAALNAHTPSPDCGDDLYSWHERRVAAVLSVGRICRSFSSAASVIEFCGATSTAASSRLVAAALVDDALDLPDPDLRLLALEVAAVTAVTTTVPTPVEYGLVHRYTRLNIKASSADVRYRSTRLVSAFMARITAGLAAARKRCADANAKVCRGFVLSCFFALGIHLTASSLPRSKLSATIASMRLRQKKKLLRLDLAMMWHACMREPFLQT